MWVSARIVHEHPNFDGAAVGESSYRDFLTLAHFVENLEGGVMLNVGTAVMGPEVYLKALSMAGILLIRKAAPSSTLPLRYLIWWTLGDDPTMEAPKTNAIYYFRPYKTVLVRTVADGGESHYIRGDHRATITHLHRLIMEKAG